MLYILSLLTHCIWTQFQPALQLPHPLPAPPYTHLNI